MGHGGLGNLEGPGQRQRRLAVANPAKVAQHVEMRGDQASGQLRLQKGTGELLDDPDFVEQQVVSFEVVVVGQIRRVSRGQRGERGVAGP